MKNLYTEAEVSYDENIKVELKGREVTVKGPMGTLKKNIPCSVTIKNDPKARKVKVYRYFNNKREKAPINTVRTIIGNMIQGCQNSYTYTCKAFYNHHPMRFSLKNNAVHVDNFLGERRAKVFPLPDGIKWAASETKDYYTITGNSKEQVGNFYSMMHINLRARGFDRRRFNDGFFIISK